MQPMVTPIALPWRKGEKIKFLTDRGIVTHLLCSTNTTWKTDLLFWFSVGSHIFLSMQTRNTIHYRETDVTRLETA